MRRPAPVLLATAVLAVSTALAACAPADQDAAGSSGGSASPASSASCGKDSLPLVSTGKFTVGTDDPAYEPWFVDNNPSNGKGFESAVAYAVAKQLGFAPSEVTWVKVPFTSAYAPGKKKFDVDINQVSITSARKQAVDFSSGYYTVAQAVVTTKGSSIAKATSVAALKNAKLGAQVGTTSYQAITDQIKPAKAGAAYDTNDLAVEALKNHQLDGIVVDLPTAFYMASAQLDDGLIVGQLPSPGSAPDQFGMVLAKGSPLTACVSQAVDALRADGTLAKLQDQWLTGAGAPLLR